MQSITLTEHHYIAKRNSEGSLERHDKASKMKSAPTSPTSQSNQTSRFVASEKSHPWRPTPCNPQDLRSVITLRAFTHQMCFFECVNNLQKKMLFKLLIGHAYFHKENKYHSAKTRPLYFSDRGRVFELLHCQKNELITMCSVWTLRQHTGKYCFLLEPPWVLLKDPIYQWFRWKKTQ